MKSNRNNITKVDLNHYYDGDIKRYMNQFKILDGESDFPQPLEYVDIDKAMIKFVEDNIQLTDSEGKEAPTFTLYSNQRFSEYSQTWEHTDKDGNLLMNFKTVTRGNSPVQGSLIGDSRNIPGERKYTLKVKTVLEDSGNEVYEIYSMKQPFTVDLDYMIAVVTSKYEKLNTFNIIINNLFKSLQCYLEVNGHFLPMLLEEISDETQYSIDDRKFFIQAAVFKVRAYIIRREDFEVKKYPKKILLDPIVERRKRKPSVEFVEYEKEGKAFEEMEIFFPPNTNKVSFDMDFDMNVCDVEAENIKWFKLYVDNDLLKPDKKIFLLPQGSSIKLIIKQFDPLIPSKLTLVEKIV